MAPVLLEIFTRNNFTSLTSLALLTNTNSNRSEERLADLLEELSVVGDLNIPSEQPFDEAEPARFSLEWQTVYLPNLLYNEQFFLLCTQLHNPDEDFKCHKQGSWMQLTNFIYEVIKGKFPRAICSYTYQNGGNRQLWTMDRRTDNFPIDCGFQFPLQVHTGI